MKNAPNISENFLYNNIRFKYILDIFCNCYIFIYRSELNFWFFYVSLCIGGITLTRSTFNLISGDRLEKMVDILKAIAHPVRLQIVNILLKSECRVGDLIKTLGTGQSLTSQELSKLKLFGVLKSRRDGNKVYYSLKNNSIKKILATILSQI